MLYDHDALLAERKGMTLEESEAHYIQTEMIEPLIGGVILGGFVHEGDDFPPFPVLTVMVKGKVYNVIISMDDEMNGGGRLIIESSGESLTTE